MYYGNMAPKLSSNYSKLYGHSVTSLFKRTPVFQLSLSLNSSWHETPCRYQAKLQLFLKPTLTYIRTRWTISKVEQSIISWRSIWVHITLFRFEYRKSGTKNWFELESITLFLAILKRWYIAPSFITFANKKTCIKSGVQHSTTSLEISVCAVILILPI